MVYMCCLCSVLVAVTDIIKTRFINVDINYAKWRSIVFVRKSLLLIYVVVFNVFFICNKINFIKIKKVFKFTQ